MLIESLYLKEYKYHRMIPLTELKIIPRNKIQLIIGQNGSSKSTTMAMYAPLPPQSTMFAKNGSKKLTIDHKGHIYEIDYDAQTKHHSFKEDGVELNTSGNSAVSEELVESHLGYNKLIDKLLFNKIMMTRMTASARMEFLTSINPVNIKFIRDKHVKIVIQLKKVKAQVELLEKRCSEYKSLLMSDFEYGSYAKDRDTLSKFDDTIIKLIYRYDTLAQTCQRGEIHRDVNEYREILKNLTHYRSKIGESYPASLKTQNTTPDTLTELQLKRDNLNHVYNDNLLKMSQISLEIDELEKIVHDSNINDLSKLEKQCEIYKEDIKKFTDFTDVFIVDWPPKGENEETVYTAVHRLGELTSLLSDMWHTPIWSTKKYNFHKTRYMSLLKRKEEATRKLLYYQEQITKAENDTAKIECSHPDSACTIKTCALRVKHENLVVRCKKEEDYLKSLYTQTEKECSKYLRILDYYNEWLPYQSQFHGSQGICADIYDTIIQIHPLLARLYPQGIDTLISKLNKNTLAVNNEVKGVLKNSNDYSEKKSLEQEIARLETLITSKKADVSVAFATKKLKSLYENLDTLERSVDNQALFIKAYDRAIEKEKKNLAAIRKTESVIADIEADIHTLEQNAKYEAYTSTRDQLNALHTHISEFLRDMDTVITEQKRYRQLYDLEHRAVNQLTQFYSELSTMERVLNPYKGLPSVYTKQHLNKILKNVNYFISQVFTYDLRVNLVEDEKEMKYKFDVLVDDIPVGDISNCSDGQMEMIDLAFTLAIMIQLKLHADYPLFLDEVGRCLDSTHSQRLLELLKNLVEQGYLHQLFIINHQAVLFGGFEHADVVCLKSENVVLPESFNEIVEMQ